eukprot:139899-Prymnesium_polylepis.2
MATNATAKALVRSRAQERTRSYPMCHNAGRRTSGLVAAASPAAWRGGVDGGCAQKGKGSGEACEGKGCMWGLRMTSEGRAEDESQRSGLMLGFGGGLSGSGSGSGLGAAAWAPSTQERAGNQGRESTGS